MSDHMVDNTTDIWETFRQAVHALKQQDFEQAIDCFQSVLGYQSDSVEILQAQSRAALHLAVCYINLNDTPNAERVLLQLLARMQSTHGQNSATLIAPLNNLGSLYLLLGNFHQAEVCWQKALNLVHVAPDILAHDTERPSTQYVVTANLYRLYREQEQHALNTPLLLDLLRHLTQRCPRSSEESLWTRNAIITTAFVNNQPDIISETVTGLMDDLTMASPVASADTRLILETLGTNLFQLGFPEHGKRCLEVSLTLFTTDMTTEDQWRYVSNLAVCHLLMKDPTGAQPYIKSSFKLAAEPGIPVLAQTLALFNYSVWALATKDMATSNAYAAVIERQVAALHDQQPDWFERVSVFQKSLFLQLNSLYPPSPPSLSQ